MSHHASSLLHASLCRMHTFHLLRNFITWKVDLCGPVIFTDKPWQARAAIRTSTCLDHVDVCTRFTVRGVPTCSHCLLHYCISSLVGGGRAGKTCNVFVEEGYRDECAINRRKLKAAAAAVARTCLFVI
jgi:hypothetical protein